MPIADRNNATNPNTIESNAGERRLASDRSVQYDIGCISNTGSCGSTAATSRRSAPDKRPGSPSALSTNVSPLCGSCASGMK